MVQIFMPTVNASDLPGERSTPVNQLLIGEARIFVHLAQKSNNRNQKLRGEKNE